MVNGKKVENEINAKEGIDPVRKTTLKALIKIDNPAHEAQDTNKERKRSRSVTINNTKGEPRALYIYP